MRVTRLSITTPWNVLTNYTPLEAHLSEMEKDWKIENIEVSEGENVTGNARVKTYIIIWSKKGV